MAWSGWSLNATPTFRGLSYDEWAKPLQQATDFHKELETQYGELDAKASMWDKLANDALGKDSKAYKQYKAYADDLRSQADDLAKNGLGYNSRRNLLNMVGRYSSEITPIEEAWNRRKQLADEQNKLLASNPELMTNKLASKESIDFFMDNPEWSYNTLNLKEHYDKVRQQASDYRKQIVDVVTKIPSNFVGNGEVLAENLKWVKSAVPGFYERYIKEGYDPKTLSKALSDPNSDMSRMIQAEIASTGLEDWDFAYSYNKNTGKAYRNSKEKEDAQAQGYADAVNRFSNYVSGGLSASYGETRTEKLEDKPWLMYMDYYYKKKLADDERKWKEEQMAKQKAERELKEKSATPFNEKETGTEVVEAENLTRDERLRINRLLALRKLQEIMGDSANNLGIRHIDAAYEGISKGIKDDELVDYMNKHYENAYHPETGEIIPESSASEIMKDYKEKQFRKKYNGLSKEIEDLFEQHELGNISLSQDELNTIKNIYKKDINSQEYQDALNNIAKNHGLKSGYESFDDYVNRYLNSYFDRDKDFEELRKGDEIHGIKPITTSGHITNFANSANADQQVRGKLSSLGEDTELVELNPTNGKRKGGAKKVGEVLKEMKEDGAETRYSIYNNSDGIGIAINIINGEEVHEYRLPYSALRGWSGFSAMVGNDVYANDIERSKVGQMNSIAYKPRITIEDKKKLIELDAYDVVDGKKVPWDRKKILRHTEGIKGNVMEWLNENFDLAYKPATTHNQQDSDGVYLYQYN